MLRYTLIAGCIWILFAGSILLSHWMSELPDVHDLLAQGPSHEITLIDVNGQTIARRGLTQGAFVEVSSLPPYVGNAFIAIEDRRFRSHIGLDPVGMARALIADLAAGAYVQGGSTITQQLAKNLFLTPDRTIDRKVEEALLALHLESRYSKDEILTLYLNHVYFGAGAYGIEAASKLFFGKRAEELSLAEAAMLAGLVKAPSRYNPVSNPDAAASRAAVVLQAMQDAGFIDDKARADAVSTRVKIARELATPGAGYFVDYVMAQLPGYAGSYDDSLIVETTLDLSAQTVAEHALAAGLAKEGSTLNARQGALVAMTPDGAIRALVGGRSYDASPFNRAIDARRQPGSAFKAFVYLAALESGYGPNDIMTDGPVSIGNWTPDNYGGKYEGPITLTRAFARSSNSVAVQLTRAAGPARVAKVAHRLGIVSDLQAVPALALGASETSLLELTTGYATFANSGMGVLPYAIASIRTVSGKILYRRKGSGTGTVMSAQHAAQMIDMMEETVSSGTGRAAALDGHPTAGKTGTSQNYRDAWFEGFTASLVCGVWIGNDDNTPMQKAVGGGLPARIFHDFMSVALKDTPAQPLKDSRFALALAQDKLSQVSPKQDASVSVAAVAAETDKAPTDSGNVLDAFGRLLDTLF
jgi:penicillin-binding protein 1A